MDSVILQMTKRGTITVPKRWRDEYGLRPGDVVEPLNLGDAFMLRPRRSEVDALADRVAGQWAQDGETALTMLPALREERDRRAC